MYTRRLLVFVVTCALAIAAISWLRPPTRDDARTADQFWSAKTHGGDGSYDIVIAGDSRTLMGIAPTAMRPALPDAAILNFGYLGAGLTPEFVRAAARKLDAASPRRTLVLAVTPLSLIASSLENKHFKEQSLAPPVAARDRLGLDAVRRLFAPLPLVAAAAPAGPVERTRYREGGWLASSGSAAPGIALGGYRMLFGRSSFEEPNFARLLDTVAELRADGVRVLAFRMPSSAAMEELENRRSGFHEADVRHRLAAAGAAWIRFAPKTPEFTSGDGSHLNTAGARAFSAALAAEIARRE